MRNAPLKRFRLMLNAALFVTLQFCRIGHFLDFRHLDIIISNNTQIYINLVSLSYELKNMV